MMSGGYFEYNQFRINDIIEQLECIDNHEIPDDIKSDITLLIARLKEGSVRVQRLDWFLSGDDSAESYRSRLQSELGEL